MRAPDLRRLHEHGAGRIRCPDHAATGRPLGQTVKAARPRLGDATLVTKALIVVNVAFYLITVAQGAGVNNPGGALFNDFALYGPFVADGDWWRLVTAAFLHASLLHIVFNMLALWWIGGPLEAAIGHWRYLTIYAIAGLAGSAGALLVKPQAFIVGASGAIFGLLGAMVVSSGRRRARSPGPPTTLILVNLAITFAVPGISWGGHLGGLVGGALATLALTHFGTRHVAYARITPVAVVSLIVIMIGSVAIAYWRVRGLA